MSTKQRYLELWKKFEKLLEEKELSLEDFARQWENAHLDDPSADYRKFIKKIKTQRERREKMTRINSNTLSQIEEYILFLEESEALFEALDDEVFGSLFT